MTMSISRSKFRDISLRWKLVFIMSSVTVATLLLFGAGLLWRERMEFEREMEARLVLLADVMGLGSTASIVFRDSAAANETLAALATDPHVMLGALYDEQGKLFVRYRRAGVDISAPAVAPSVPNISFNNGIATLTRPIVLNRREVGKVYILSDSENWTTVLWQFVGIIFGLIVIVLTIGVLISIWLQRIVTEPITDLVRVMTRIGQEGNFDLRATRHANDEIGFLVGGFNDMLNEVSKSRFELHALNEELEQRVRERTAQLETANKELESFSYSVSHDLRAPLRAIDGFSHALAEDYADKLDSEGKDFLQRVRRGCQRMGELIDDMLSLARVVRHEMRYESVDLGNVAGTIIEQLAQADRERKVEVSISDGLRVNGDPGLLRIALENLLNNAWKFTRTTKQARIELGTLTKDDERVFYVRDNGAGFDMTYADKLFRAFQRLHDASAFPGSGIGLATVLRVIHRHGGRIWAEGTVGNGATFYFTLKEGP
jgi:signal transduction histidine kinase